MVQYSKHLSSSSGEYLHTALKMSVCCRSGQRCMQQAVDSIADGSDSSVGEQPSAVSIAADKPAQVPSPSASLLVRQ